MDVDPDAHANTVGDYDSWWTLGASRPDDDATAQTQKRRRDDSTGHPAPTVAKVVYRKFTEAEAQEHTVAVYSVRKSYGTQQVQWLPFDAEPWRARQAMQRQLAKAPGASERDLWWAEVFRARPGLQMGSAECTREREACVTGTEAATLAGVNPWSGRDAAAAGFSDTREWLLARKTGQAGDKGRNANMQRGIDEEQEAADLFEALTGIELVPETPGFIRHPDGLVGASPDRRARWVPLLLEIKSKRDRFAFFVEHNYWWQMQQQMYVTGIHSCVYLQYISSRAFAGVHIPHVCMHLIQFDAASFDAYLRDYAAPFAIELAQRKGVPPPPAAIELVRQAGATAAVAALVNNRRGASASAAAAAAASAAATAPMTSPSHVMPARPAVATAFAPAVATMQSGMTARPRPYQQMNGAMVGPTDAGAGYAAPWAPDTGVDPRTVHTGAPPRGRPATSAARVPARARPAAPFWAPPGGQSAAAQRIAAAALAAAGGVTGAEAEAAAAAAMAPPKAPRAPRAPAGSAYAGLPPGTHFNGQPPVKKPRKPRAPPKTSKTGLATADELQQLNDAASAAIAAVTAAAARATAVVAPAAPRPVPPAAAARMATGVRAIPKTPKALVRRRADTDERARMQAGVAAMQAAMMLFAPPPPPSPPVAAGAAKTKRPRKAAE